MNPSRAGANVDVEANMKSILSLAQILLDKYEII